MMAADKKCVWLRSVLLVGLMALVTLALSSCLCGSERGGDISALNQALLNQVVVTNHDARKSYAPQRAEQGDEERLFFSKFDRSSPPLLPAGSRVQVLGLRVEYVRMYSPIIPSWRLVPILEVRLKRLDDKRSYWVFATESKYDKNTISCPALSRLGDDEPLLIYLRPIKGGVDPL